MKRNTDMMLALARIGELATKPLDTSEILTRVVAITAEIVKVDACSIYLYDVDGMLVLEATMGLSSDAVGKVSIPPGEGITGRAAKQGRTVAVRDVTLDKRNKYIPITGEEAFRSILSVPLVFHEENIGVINVQTRAPRTFLKHEKQLLKTIASQVSGIIRNARLYESTIAAKRELEEANERLIESEKMAALGRLSATLSHELRNPLSGLKGASQLLYRKTSETDERRQYITLILEEVDRLGKIVDDLIHFARPKSLQLDMVDANGTMEDVLLLHSEDLNRRNITIRKRLSKLPPINVDRDKFKQVLVNILLNAIDAMPEGGELLVSSSATISNETASEVATFQFRDTGHGIPDDIISKVFEPFYTTKTDGVGLGLAVCKSIIEQHNGIIAIRSFKTHTDAQGTLITIEIPIHATQQLNTAQQEATPLKLTPHE